MNTVISNIKNRICAWLWCGILLSFIPEGFAADTPAPSPPVAPYLQPGAPVFSDTIPRFRERFNTENPETPLPEYRTLDTGQPANLVVLAVSRISSNFYSSTAIEAGSGKIKTLQITWIPQTSGEDSVSREKALSYMAALIRFFSPQLSAPESRKKLDALIKSAHDNGTRFHAEGALRYVISNQGNKGLTLAIEPVRLILNNS